MPGKVKESGQKLRLFHFSDDGGISEFAPRRPDVVPPRPPGREWLNDPLVWAIEEDFQFLYLFPRNCPRVLVWPKPDSTKQDQKVWMGSGGFRAVAYAEEDWLARIQSASIYRYELPGETFENLEDAGMWVSRWTVSPTGLSPVTDLPTRLADLRVDLRIVDSLLSIQPVWQTTLHVSSIRMRNAKERQGATHGH
jgi:hypothetical protein